MDKGEEELIGVQSSIDGDGLDFSVRSISEVSEFGFAFFGDLK